MRKRDWLGLFVLYFLAWVVIFVIAPKTAHSQAMHEQLPSQVVLETPNALNLNVQDVEQQREDNQDGTLLNPNWQQFPNNSLSSAIRQRFDLDRSLREDQQTYVANCSVRLNRKNLVGCRIRLN